LVKAAAVVPAAGTGSRMGAQVPKQYLLLGGIPLLGHALKVLDSSPVIQSIVLVAGAGEEEFCRKNVVKELGIRKIKAIVTGGRERQDSVYSGILALSPETDLVVIHDGARPLLSSAELLAVVEAAVGYGAATLAVPVKDTVKMAGGDGLVAQTLPRERLWLTQTPQAFRRDLILRAHRAAREANHLGTDDAGLVERLGFPVKLVPGSYRNIKVTTPEDLIIASALLATPAAW
jgi:2-C-methyl-D-erythritol 4-phosphate cytidylyltransferase